MASSIMDSAKRFGQAIPEEIIHLLDPHALVATEVVRERIAEVVAVLILVLAVRAFVGAAGWLRDLFTGRSLSVRGTGFSSLLRKLAVIALVSLPIYRLIETLGGHDPGDAYSAMAWMAGLLWLVLRAMVRDKTWLESGERLVRIRTGFAVFTITDITIDLGTALLDATMRAPVGKQAKGRPVYILRPAFEQLEKALGGKSEATAWLQSAVGAIGLVPAGQQMVGRSS